MPDIDPVSLNYLLVRKTKLNFPLDCDVFEEVKSTLSKKQIDGIMKDLGKYLGKLHLVSGDGFGLVDPRYLDKYELKGGHKTWYDFWDENFKIGFAEMDKVLDAEKRTKSYSAYLSGENRELMYKLLGKKREFLKIFRNSKKLLTVIESRFINGNVYTKNITLRKGKFVGLTDFSKALLGDPVDELAYFSIMPGSGEYVKLVTESWKKIVPVSNFDERFRLYRLIEAYRKILTRYIKHKYLDDYPEPLAIAEEELAYYNIR